MTDQHGHIPVLLDEVLEVLAPQPGETAVDCTVGRGGHAEALLSAVGAAGSVIGFDADADNVRYASERLALQRGEFIGIHDSFVRLPHHLQERQVSADMILADLGFASNQMTDPSRGFSFTGDGPLDMRLDRRSPFTAADLLQSMSEQELRDCIRRYGEEPLAARIAREIITARQRQPLQTTGELAKLVDQAYGGRARQSRMHPATRTFQALRIAVNDELGALQALLDQIEAAGRDAWLNRRARIAIISFHSLEDRIVKQTFRRMEKDHLGQAIMKRPIVPEAAEIEKNPRSRSAKLRAFQLA